TISAVSSIKFALAVLSLIEPAPPCSGRRSNNPQDPSDPSKKAMRVLGRSAVQPIRNDYHRESYI
ncbi:MAG: hypothetical protein Q7V40_12760, partial [Pseudolabrys sp.]|nr:hypothetical protein [Pseudolabrys sp.]